MDCPLNFLDPTLHSFRLIKVFKYLPYDREYVRYDREYVRIIRVASLGLLWLSLQFFLFRFPLLIWVQDNELSKT